MTFPLAFPFFSFGLLRAAFEDDYDDEGFRDEFGSSDLDSEGDDFDTENEGSYLGEEEDDILF